MFDEPYYNFIIHGLFLFLSIFFALLINWLLLRFARTLGMRNVDDANMIRWGTTSKPSLGGFSFYILFLFSIAAYGLFPSEIMVFDKKILGLLLASTLGFLVGLADDAYNTNPLVKFIGQFTCANILITTGFIIEVTPVYELNYFISTIWIIGLMNSINMLDNMDAITTLVSIMVVIGAIVLLFIGGDHGNLYLLILFGVLGSLIGFLFFNFHPSKMYMGDTGSQFLGVFLAAISILFFWTFKQQSGEFFQLRQFVVPALMFIVPLIDTATVFIRRLARRQSPFVGGKDHITHHLAYLGLSDRQVALVLGGLSFVSIIIVAYLAAELPNWHVNYTIILLVYFLMMFLLFQLMYNYSQVKLKKNNVIT